MPELPEIEHLRRTLEPHLVGARVVSVNLRRRDVVRVAGSRKALRGVKPAMLLEGDRIARLIRVGKSLALVGESGRVLALHMGMTGTMRVAEETKASRHRGIKASASAISTSGGGGGRQSLDALMPRCLDANLDKHVHCAWVMERGGEHTEIRRAPHPPPNPLPQERGESRARFRVVFRDPRRFGGLWPFASMDDLHERAWKQLGPDALTIDAATLRERLARTRQPMKAALLNQKLIAGVGNIYADEALFAARIHPLMRPTRLRDDDWKRLARAIRNVLRAAINAGGSSIRDYRDASGNNGEFVARHRVYGRAGEPCLRCRGTLNVSIIGQRTTVFCPHCQPRYPQAVRAIPMPRSGRRRATPRARQAV